MVYSKPSELLRDMNSHGIYGVGMLTECHFDTSCIPVHTVEETAAAIKARGLGGELRGKPHDRVIYGYSTSSALALQYLGNVPGDTFMGRGSSFRANLKALEAVGK